MLRSHLGINVGQDQSAALVIDGEIRVAIQQERLDRVKYSVGILLQSPGIPSAIRLPDAAIRYCLDACGLDPTDISTITANMPGHDYGPRILADALPASLRDKIRTIPSHHLAHAYSAWWPCGFDEALVLVADGTGSTDAAHRTESYTLFNAHGEKLERLHGETVEAHLAELSTLGFIYEYISGKAGFFTHLQASDMSVAEAGKLMGLAPYGGPQKHWERWIRSRPDGYGLDISAYDIFLEVAALEKRYDDGSGKPYLRPYLVDLAFKVQKELEDALLHVIGRALRETGLRRLCVAGGVGLNSVANYQLLRQLDLDDIFVFPAAGDSGISAGCALWAYAADGGTRRPKLARATLGRTYADDELRAALDRFSQRVDVEALSHDKVVERSAEAIAQGHILARFEQGSEYGPRALGHRSILADPAYEGMRDIINARVKFRERFRPFAPVIPEEDVNTVFEQSEASPFMLLVARIRPEFHERIPAVTHCDGSGRVQTVNAEDNPYAHALCRRLADLRGGPPVILNTSYNVAGQPIVETPEEAIETFLETDIDYLCLENFWVTKKSVPAPSYEENLKKIAATPLPRGLLPDAPGVRSMMAALDQALFGNAAPDCPWTQEELRNISAEAGRLKETSRLFPDNPFGKPFRARLSEETLLLLDPLGTSQLVRQSERPRIASYRLHQVQLLFAVLDGEPARLDGLRIQRGQTTLEWARELDWGASELASFGLAPTTDTHPAAPADSARPETARRTFEAFADTAFTQRSALAEIRNSIVAAGYRAETICSLLGVTTLAQIQPTHLHYYDLYRLPKNDLSDLIRLFLLRGSLPREHLVALFGESGCDVLIDLGILIPRKQEWASRVDLYAIDELILATDHRYMLLDEDRLDESPVMYIGLDSLGLVHTAPRHPVNETLDLCTGSGVQALAASRYSRRVIGVDTNPRAIRFARFNAQLNGITNVEFRRGDLYEAVPGTECDIILANPPFVPSPNENLTFRDGGPRGDLVLERIVTGAPRHLRPLGRLHIVTDLADLGSFEATLNRWWQGGPAHKLILQTADRDEILFSVAHSHHPFNQTFEEYNEEITRWVENFRAAGLRTVNFGYILMERLAEGPGAYCARVIHNPNLPIHEQVKGHFSQQALLRSKDGGASLYLSLAPDLRIHTEADAAGRFCSAYLGAENNHYYSTYQINEQVLSFLRELSTAPARLGDFTGRDEHALVLQLISKDILQLSPSRRSAGLRPHTSNESPEAASASKEPTVPTGMIRFEEMESKTTPTCLTSYMRRR